MTSSTSVRVASVPARHVYVRHLAAVDESNDIVRLPDPSDPWWPPAMLAPRWVRDHADEFDLMHVHFGFDGVSPEALDDLGQTLHQMERPLVITVHDLRNPHHPTPELHELQLGALIRHATKLVTLTDHAARLIRERFGRCAQVIPHPHIVELEEMRRRQSEPRVRSSTVGLHLKSLRPNMETAVVEAAVAAVREVPGAELLVNVHLDVADPHRARHDQALMDRLRRLGKAGALRLVTHDFFTDEQFVAYLASLRVSVLPYRFGTHSGWLEACRDLGVAVVAPDCGSYHDQGPVFGFGCNETTGFDAKSCTAAIVRALRSPRPDPVPWQERLDQRQQIAVAHRRIYLDALAAFG